MVQLSARLIQWVAVKKLRYHIGFGDWGLDLGFRYHDVVRQQILFPHKIATFRIPCKVYGRNTV